MNTNDATDVDRILQPDRSLPPPAEWSPVAVRLLQGVVYHDDGEAQWELLLRSVSPLADYFAKLGLLLIVDEVDAMAYLKQVDEDEWPSDYPVLPRIFRRTPLTYEVTLLCILIRDELRQFEEHDVQNARCIVAQNDLLQVWTPFFPDEQDSVKLNRSLGASLRKLEELRFVRLFEKEPPTWEVRRIIKARLPLTDLERLRASLADELTKRHAKISTPSHPNGIHQREGTDLTTSESEEV